MPPFPGFDTRPFHHYILVLLQASTWGRCPPQPVPLLGHAPACPSSLRLAQTSFEPNLYLYKYPSSLLPVILLVHTTWRWNRQSVPKHRHIKFRCWEITQKEEYSSLEISVKFNKPYTSIIKMEFSVTETPIGLWAGIQSANWLAVASESELCRRWRHLQVGIFSLRQLTVSKILVTGTNFCLCVHAQTACTAHITSCTMNGGSCFYSR